MPPERHSERSKPVATASVDDEIPIPWFRKEPQTVRPSNAAAILTVQNNRRPLH